MNLESLIGQTLDEKYRIERELGRGGMGAVYLATHVGTERHVALKVIVPQFMQRAEFVERFRREARAAGRLRHPNVVDVTDFGFASAAEGKVAYLVMEYLDGCTLGEVLEEEKQLPLPWTLDILEQVGSAIHAAHEQGIIHRDLKPDNIWLEPNQRGGYTVKVLDFGIAKLENAPLEDFGDSHDNLSVLPTTNAQSTRSSSQRQTAAGDGESPTMPENGAGGNSRARGTIADAHGSKTFSGEAGTLIQPLARIDTESGTAIMPAPAANTTTVENATAEQPSEAGTQIIAERSEAGTQIISKQSEAGTQIITEQNEAGTKLISQADGAEMSIAEKRKTSELTRVGAVLGTPLYMSPEQCRGEHLTPQSDIYSLGVIAYQMLAGKTPFTGDYLEVMKAHKESTAPRVEAKKVPRKVKKIIAAAMDKNPAARPPSAEAFASELRAQSEGFGALFRRALEIYSRHLPSFLLLSLILYAPLALFTILDVASGFLPGSGTGVALAQGGIKLVTVFVSMFCSSLLAGTTTWLIAQILAFPLRPVTLRPALAAARKKWRSLVGTSFLSGIVVIVGYAFCFLPGLLLSVFWALGTSIVMMENLRGRAALRRSKTLIKRSFWTAFATVLMIMFLPVAASLFIGFFAKAVVREVTGDTEKISITRPAKEGAANSAESGDKPGGGNFSINLGGNGAKITEGQMEKIESNKLKYALREALTQIIYLPISILMVSLFMIIVALLYFKTRQAAGESMQDLLAQFEEADQPRKDWQKRVRERLIQSGRMPSRAQSSGNDRRTTGGVRSET